MSDNSSGISIDYRKLAAACRVEPGTTVDLEHNFDPGRADHRLGKQGAERRDAAPTLPPAIPDGCRNPGTVRLPCWGSAGRKCAR